MAPHNYRDQSRCDEKTDDELGKAPPYLPYLRLWVSLRALPFCYRNNGQRESPNTNPNVAANYFNQRVGSKGLVRCARDACGRPCQPAIGLSRSQPGGIRKFGS